MYLYGASIKGIQSFIFDTNKLQEIAGASLLVDYISTTFFEECVNNLSTFYPDDLILAAAGNIKYLFQTKEACQKLVYDFPKKVMEMAPGITICQAVIHVPEGIQKEHIRELEEKLAIQRNKQQGYHQVGWMIAERSRKTGKPGVDNENGSAELLDDASVKKRSFQRERQEGDVLMKKVVGSSIPNRYYPFEIEDLAPGTEKRWVAVVHADGNNLGKKLMALSDRLENEQTKRAFREVSEKIGRSTEKAVRKAYSETFANLKVPFNEKNKIPIRPVILGGDDVTVIIEATKALTFTRLFLTYFEKFTREAFKDFEEDYGCGVFSKGLTACAGIAYIKPKYPFYYGVHLAETLCKVAKKVSKASVSTDENGQTIGEELAPSSVFFHKVHSSFVQNDFEELEEKELIASNYYFSFGPYFLEHKVPQGYASVTDLEGWVNMARKENAPSGPIRNWLTELKKNENAAEQLMRRIKSLNGSFDSSMISVIPQNGSGKQHYCFRPSRGDKKFTHLYDVINLASI